MTVRIPLMLGRLTLVVALVLASMLLGGVARAGGPTSVLLVSPQSHHAAALYTGDQDYARLMTMLGESPVAAADPPTTASDPAYVTVTWLVHDVAIWRLDRIFFDTRDGPWVVTQFLEPGEPVVEMFPGEQGGPEAVWHRPADPAALGSLLAGLGLRGGASDVAVAEPDVAVAEPVAAAGVPAAAEPGDGWWWALPGAVLGAAATLLARRFGRRREPDPEAPALVVNGW